MCRLRSWQYGQEKPLNLNLFVHLQGERREKSVSSKSIFLSFFLLSREVIFPLSCLEKEYALLATATHTLRYLVMQWSLKQCWRLNLLLNDYFCRVFKRTHKEECRKEEDAQPLQVHMQRQNIEHLSPKMPESSYSVTRHTSLCSNSVEGPL